MKNKKYYPFDRNNYFYGKLLTVRDFEVEQRYINDKRRLNNRLVNGAGVVNGLNVVLIDDQTISLEMGVALDYLGREIVVEEPVTKKLNLIPGFQELSKPQDSYLCIQYHEELTEPVHSVAANSLETQRESQYNRVRESYQLFMTDVAPKEELLSINCLLEDTKLLYQDDQVTISQTVPRYINPEQKLEVKVDIVKKGSADLLEVDYQLVTNHLVNHENSKSTRVYYFQRENGSELNIQLKIPLYARNVKETVEQLAVDMNSWQVKLGDKILNLTDIDQKKFQVLVINEPVQERVISSYFSRHFDEVVTFNQHQFIYLAKLDVLTSESSYLIQSLEKMPFNQYIFNNQLLYLLLGLNTQDSNQSSSNTDCPDKLLNNNNQQLESMKANERSFATGVTDIELDLGSNKNKRYISNEIAHGLGSGPVAIITAIEDQQDPGEVFESDVLLFGNNEVFEKTPYQTKLPQFRLGAMSYQDKGTFRIGMQLLDNTTTTNVNVRWWAYKHLEGDQDGMSLAELNKITVSIYPDTVTLSPREKLGFSSTIEGTSNQECRWYIQDQNGGQIDVNGVYQAPTAEGVYEIVAESVQYPVKKASAYVVVKA